MVFPEPGGSATRPVPKKVCPPMSSQNNPTGDDPSLVMSDLPEIWNRSFPSCTPMPCAHEKAQKVAVSLKRHLAENSTNMVLKMILCPANAPRINIV